MEHLGFVFLVGIFAGALGSLIGVGGGFVTVPALFLGLKLPPQMVIGASLTMAFFNAVSGSLNYWRQKRIDLASGWKFALATVPGAIFGAQLSSSFTEHSFSLVFGLLLLVLALVMYWRSQLQIQNTEKSPQLSTENKTQVKTWGWVERKLTDREGNLYNYAFNETLGIVVSFGVGIISSALGIGGGIIHVPFLIMVLGFPPHIATATSLFILSGSALVGAISHFTLGHFPWVLALSLSIGGIIGAQIGARISAKIDGQKLLRIFAFILLFMGLRLVFA